MDCTKLDIEQFWLMELTPALTIVATVRATGAYGNTATITGNEK
jgi:hypothetical protein